MGMLQSLTDFLNKGGDVLWLIFFLSVCLWFLICDRLVYFRFYYPLQERRWLTQWKHYNNDSARAAFYVRRYILSEAKISLRQSLASIKILVVISPMLGLLGTVVGMIHVFDVMAVVGNGSARSMAAGISQATISTMAGMIIAISGLYCQKFIEKRIQDKIQQLAFKLD